MHFEKCVEIEILKKHQRLNLIFLLPEIFPPEGDKEKRAGKMTCC